MAISCQYINISENPDGSGSHLEFHKFPLGIEDLRWIKDLLSEMESPQAIVSVFLFFFFYFFFFFKVRPWYSGLTLD